MIRILVIIFLLFFETTFLFPDNTQYKFDRLTTADGLSSNTITSVLKDKQGFIWIGTIDGLNRFDGNSFKIFHPKSSDKTSISDSWIIDICDDDNYLWIGTPNGLNRFDKATEQFKKFRFDPQNNSTLSNDYVTSICISNDQKIWVGTEDGLNLFDTKTEKFIRYKNDIHDTSDVNHNFIKEIIEDKQGILWIGTFGGGLNRYDIKNNSFKFFMSDPKHPESLSNDFIEDMIEDSSGNLWITTKGGGVNKFNKAKETFERFVHEPDDNSGIPGNDVKGISIDKDKQLWLGIEPEGVSIFDPMKGTFTNILNNTDNASLENISNIYCDDHGSIWICTSQGVSIYNKSKWKFDHYRNIPGDTNSLNNNNVLSICDDVSGNIWVVTEAGLQILNKGTGTFQSFMNNLKDTGSFNVQHVFRDKKNYMWISTGGGPLKRYSTETGTTDLYYDIDGGGFSSRSIFEDKDENLWIGSWTGGGITVLDRERKFKRKYLNTKNDFADFSHAPVYNIFQDSKGNVWIATFEGLIRIDPVTEEIVFYKNDPDDTNTLSDNRVTGIVEDKKGFLWITTYGEGLNRFDPVKNQFRHYIEDWLAADIITGILPDDKGNLWLGNFKGISKFTPDDESFINYAVGDGVQGVEFSIGSFYKTKDGEMYFGGTNGFNAFYPDRISQNKNIPNIVITDFRIFNKEARLDRSITETKEITISHNENFFSFDFAALDYTNPAKNQYAYMLEGIDEDWNYTGKVRTANYTDIAPGEYTFKVKGTNNDGVWNDDGTSLKLIITPPFYKTLWFRGLAVLIILGVTGVIFRQKLKRIKTEKRTQDEFMKKLIESQENERKRVASELHDSLGQHLLIIKNKALIGIRKTDDVAKLKSQMNEISELSSTMIEEVREISYNLRPYELDRLGLSKTLLSIIERVNKSTGINFNIEIDNIDKIFDSETEISIYRIVQEILNNIIKHSAATEVTGSITIADGEIEIFIKDNGRGFDVHKDQMVAEKKGFGLKGIPERVKLLKGTYKIESDPGKGTRIRICIPFEKRI